MTLPPPVTSDSNDSPSQRTICLDGRTLEGGGQLVRIAVALAALTGQAIQIDHVRGNRPGKKGLKGSHVAAIQFLANVSGGTLTGVEVGSSTLTFVPRPPADAAMVLRPDINILLPTAGSVFLVFQAVYPYLLHTATTPIRLSITGGTNVSFAPSFDYVAQVLAPNLARLGLPRLSVHLDRRAWATGPFQLGRVTMLVEPLRRRDRDHPDRERDVDGDHTALGFPPLDLESHPRSSITRIDITVLAPDDLVVDRAARRPTGRNGRASRSEGHTTVPSGTLRQSVEQEVLRGLRRGLKTMPSCVFGVPEAPSSSGGSRSELDAVEELADRVPIRIHTSEATRHHSHLYILIVAHTATGFVLGHDALHGARPARAKGHHATDRTGAAAMELAQQCVAGFLQELYDPRLQGSSTPAMAVGHQPCVDAHLRDQIVIFEALGRGMRAGEQSPWATEDQRYWSLHTRTAQWVCEEILGIDQ